MGEKAPFIFAACAFGAPIVSREAHFASLSSNRGRRPLPCIPSLPALHARRGHRGLSCRGRACPSRGGIALRPGLAEDLRPPAFFRATLPAAPAPGSRCPFCSASLRRRSTFSGRRAGFVGSVCVAGSAASRPRGVSRSPRGSRQSLPRRGGRGPPNLRLDRECGILSTEAEPVRSASNYSETGGERNLKVGRKGL